MLKKLKIIKDLSCEEARSILDYFSNKMLNSNDIEKNDIKHLFIELLNDSKNYEYFSFGELVLFFLFESEEFSKEEKKLIMKYICNNIQQVCNSRNDMVPAILMDFIVRHIGQDIRNEYCNNINLNSSDGSIKKCLNIILEKDDLLPIESSEKI